MRPFITIVRFFVGILFIFSGLVKANDPMGLSFKMQEFFEIWGLHSLMPYTLGFAVLMNAFEIIAGVALLIGWRIKVFSWLLLLLILFFTALTGYTFYTGMPKNCGCFGDCLPISSQTSFYKDVLLTILIIIILRKKDLIGNSFSFNIGNTIMILIAVFSFGLQYYSLDRLPIVDCLPYKVGNNIQEKMKMPANAVLDSFQIEFTYKKEDKLVSFSASNFPSDFSSDKYEFVSRKDVLIRKGHDNEPPIKGFVLTDSLGNDYTDIVLEQPSAILFFIERFQKAGHFEDRFNSIFKASAELNIPCYLITAEPHIAVTELQKRGLPILPIFTADIKAIQTAARANPTVLLLKKGTIVAKYGGTGITGIVDHLNHAK